MPDAALQLTSRSRKPEIMDGNDWTRQEFADCLRQMETLNRLARGYHPTLQALRHFATGKQPLRVLDVGFGYGDTLRQVARWAKRNGVDVRLTGIDVSRVATAEARMATPVELPIKYVTADALNYAPEDAPDVIINALFMHHLSDRQVVAMLRWMRDSARLGFFINDLRRSRVARAFIWAFTRLFHYNRLVCHDAPLSVARGFKAHEWRAFADQAGLERSRLSVRRHLGYRYGVRYDREV